MSDYLIDPFKFAVFDPTLLPWDWLVWAEPNTGYPNAVGPPWPRSWTVPANNAPTSWLLIMKGDTGLTSMGAPVNRGVYHTSVAAFNGHAAVQIDALNNQYYTRTPVTRSQPVTFAAIMRYTGAPSVGRTLWTSFDTGSNNYSVSVNTGQTWRIRGGGLTTTGGLVDANVHLLVFEINGASSTLEIDGNVVVGPFNLGTAALDPSPNTHVLGNIGAPSTSFGWLGDIAFAGYLPRLLTAQEKADLHAWSQGFYATP